MVIAHPDVGENKTLGGGYSYRGLGMHVVARLMGQFCGIFAPVWAMFSQFGTGYGSALQRFPVVISNF